MELDKIKQSEIRDKIESLSFHDAIDTYINILKYYASSSKMKNFLTCHSFLKYIYNNIEKFKKLIDEDKEIKLKLQELFKINMEIERDSLVIIIVDNPNNGDLIKFLNSQLNFQDYYLTDDIMSIVTTADEVIYSHLNNSQKRYIYSVFYNVYYSEEEQLNIYKENLKEYSDSFIKKLFLYSGIISEQTSNDTEMCKKINKAMFSFMEDVLEHTEKLDNYIYNVSHIYDCDPTEKDFYNTFLIGLKYPDIHISLLNNKISNNDIYKKIRTLSLLPQLKGITTIYDLTEISNEELYQMEIDETFSTDVMPDSTSAKNDYEYEIFDNNRQVIKIADEEIKVVQLTDDENKVIGTEYSHFAGLRSLYPEYSDKEILGEIITLANTVSHDIIIITEGDSLSIWLPNKDNISASQIKLLAEKLGEITDFLKISITVAIESDGNYFEIPFSTKDILIDYLKNSKKVRR